MSMRIDIPHQSLKLTRASFFSQLRTDRQLRAYTLLPIWMTKDAMSEQGTHDYLPSDILYSTVCILRGLRILRGVLFPSILRGVGDAVIQPSLEKQPSSLPAWLTGSSKRDVKARVQEQKKKQKEEAYVAEVKQIHEADTQTFQKRKQAIFHRGPGVLSKFKNSLGIVPTTKQKKQLPAEKPCSQLYLEFAREKAQTIALIRKLRTKIAPMISFLILINIGWIGIRAGSEMRRKRATRLEFLVVETVFLGIFSLLLTLRILSYPRLKMYVKDVYRWHWNLLEVRKFCAHAPCVV